MIEFEEFIGKKFGKLVVVKYVGKSKSDSPLFECQCECGNTAYASSTQLRNGQKKSCGCLKKEHHYEYKKKIADLKAKLTEQKLLADNIIKSYVEANKNLGEQLVEKEKELKRIKKNWELSKGQQKRLYDSLKLRCKDALEQIDQDKISFAVEQLSQAIKNIKKCNYKDFGIIYQSDAIAVIDKQIEELKKEENK